MAPPLSLGIGDRQHICCYPRQCAILVNCAEAALCNHPKSLRGKSEQNDLPTTGRRLVPGPERWAWTNVLGWPAMGCVAIRPISSPRTIWRRELFRRRRIWAALVGQEQARRRTPTTFFGRRWRWTFLSRVHRHRLCTASDHHFHRGTRRLDMAVDRRNLDPQRQSARRAGTHAARLTRPAVSTG
jgi:hypothetical protein